MEVSVALSDKFDILKWSKHIAISVEAFYGAHGVWRFPRIGSHGFRMVWPDSASLLFSWASYPCGVAFSVTTRVYFYRHMFCDQPEIPWHDHKNRRRRSVDNDFTYRDAGFLPLAGATRFRLVYGDHIIWSLSPDADWKHHEVWRDKRALRKEQMDVGVTLIEVLCRTEWCGLSHSGLRYLHILLDELSILFPLLCNWKFISSAKTCEEKWHRKLIKRI